MGCYVARMFVTPLVAAAALLMQAQASPPPAGPHVVRRAYGAMGTEIKLTAWTADEAKTAKARRKLGLRGRSDPSMPMYNTAQTRPSPRRNCKSTPHCARDTARQS